MPLAMAIDRALVRVKALDMGLLREAGYSMHAVCLWAPLRASAVLLQREIPEHVNVALAKAAAAARVPVLQDVGGEDRPISDEQLAAFGGGEPPALAMRRTCCPTCAGEKARVGGTGGGVVTRATMKRLPVAVGLQPSRPR